jgi:putative heme-binding domain-containing protein
MTPCKPPFISVLAALAICLTGPARAAEDGFVSLFNGKDLSGWDGNPELWSVEDGAITGKTKGPGHLTYNQFLIWRDGTLKNFELRAKIKVTGNNTGIQYRSKELPENGKWSIGGYQCDVHPAAENNAMLYHERGRGIVAKNGQTVVVDPQGLKWLTKERDAVKVDVAEWNEYTVIAKGNHLVHKLNGKVTAEIDDYEEANRSLEGLLAFQVHQGPAMVVQIKDVQLKVLPEGGVTPFAKADLPSDAQEIQKPAPKGAPKGPGQPKGKAKEMPKGKGSPGNPGQAAAKAKAKEGPKRPAQVGPAIGENKATPVARIKVPEGFAVELLYSVPGVEEGSWVNLCADDKGRIYASDQYGGLYRLPAPAPGKVVDPASVKKLPLEMRAVNGMVFAFGALYVGVNDYEGLFQSGLYRITDSDGNDELDKVELLRAIDSKGDHGVHAIVPTPDGKSLFLICGNNATPTEAEPTSQVPAIWGEDHLLPRMPDGRGHNRHVLAPGGIIYRVSPDGKKFERYASGFRNIFDAGVNHAGELFTYDADMEYDFNTPWYRPTRVNHVVSGGEYGWRNGAGKRPEFYSDNLPGTVNIGPGSPTGVTFGYGAKFPAKYQKAFYILDWSWGKVYAVHLTPDGASYTGQKEDFITGFPLPVTDAIIHPKDGAMYFAIGGRRVQSGLYRVTYTGSEDTSPVTADTSITEAAKLRHELEAFHGHQDPKAIDAAWPHLSSKDRHIRWAARTAIEHQPVATWKEKALTESDPAKQVNALLALARAAGIDPYHRVPAKPLGGAPGEAAPKAAAVDLPEGVTPTPAPDTALRDRILAALVAIDFASLDHASQLTLVRTVGITLNRFDRPGQEVIDSLIADLDPVYPAKQFDLNWLLTETLAYLQAPNVAEKGIKLLSEANSQEEQLEYARSLRVVTTGWTKESRTAYLNWFLKAANYRGGASFDKFIEFIRTDALATFTDAEKTELSELISHKPERISAIENVGAIFAGRTPTMWTLEELSAATESGMKNRDFDIGRKMFAAAACYACHRFRDGGGMNGPDLTGAGGRYSPHDLLDQIINPSKEINEQFAPIVVTQNDGTVVSGVVVNLSGDGVTLNTDLSDPNQRVNVDRKVVKSIETSKISPMPPMLLSMLKKEEILDLLAYVLSGGDAENEMFGK